MNSAQLLDRTPGLTYRMLDYWVRQGYLRHYERWKDSSGVSREFSGDEVRVAQVMARLVLTADFKPAVAEKVARGQTEIAPGVIVLVDITPDPDRRAIDRAIVLERRRILRSPKVRRLLARRAAVKVGAHR